MNNEIHVKQIAQFVHVHWSNTNMTAESQSTKVGVGDRQISSQSDKKESSQII